MNSLQGRVAVVTGASSGIGEAIAEAFATAGAKVVAAARREEALQGLVARVKASGGQALAVRTDVTLDADIARLFERSLSAFGTVDILVNNAGVSAPGRTEELMPEAWRRVIDTNLTAAFLCSREALKVMKPKRSGRIINIGSISSKMPRPHSAAYTTSKFGLEGLTRSLALDGREFGITASVIQPGNVDTEIWAGREEAARREGMLSPHDVARIALMVATLPADANLLEAIVLPVTQPFLGRG